MQRYTADPISSKAAEFPSCQLVCLASSDYSVKGHRSTASALVLVRLIQGTRELWLRPGVIGGVGVYTPL